MKGRKVNDMFVKSEETAVFYGTQTSIEDRKILHDAGFVHITGLVASRPHGRADEYVIGERLTSESLGKWEYNNGHTVVVTIGGEVWLQAGNFNQPNLEIAKERFAPNGQGAFVPCSNGEEVNQYQLLRRVANPNDGLVIQAK